MTRRPSPRRIDVRPFRHAQSKISSSHHRHARPLRSCSASDMPVPLPFDLRENTCFPASCRLQAGSVRSPGICWIHPAGPEYAGGLWLADDRFRREIANHRRQAGAHRVRRDALPAQHAGNVAGDLAREQTRRPQLHRHLYVLGSARAPGRSLRLFGALRSWAFPRRLPERGALRHLAHRSLRLRGMETSAASHGGSSPRRAWSRERTTARSCER